MLLTLKKVKEMSSEELIGNLVLVNVNITKRQSHPTKAQVTSEQRIVKELCERFNLDEAKLTELLNQ